MAVNTVLDWLVVRAVRSNRGGGTSTSLRAMYSGNTSGPQPMQRITQRGPKFGVGSSIARCFAAAGTVHGDIDMRARAQVQDCLQHPASERQDGDGADSGRHRIRRCRGAYGCTAAVNQLVIRDHHGDENVVCLKGLAGLKGWITRLLGLSDWQCQTR